MIHPRLSMIGYKRRVQIFERVKVAVTDSSIKRLKREAEIEGRVKKLSDGGKLYLVCRPGAHGVSAEWHFRYTDNKQDRTLTLGKYGSKLPAMAGTTFGTV